MFNTFLGKIDNFQLFTLGYPTLIVTPQLSLESCYLYKLEINWKKCTTDYITYITN